MRKGGTERKIIDIEKEEERTQDRALRYTTCDIGRGRGFTIVEDKLFPIGQIIGNQLVGNASNTIMIQLLNKYRMIKSIECLAKVKKNTNAMKLVV